MDRVVVSVFDGAIDGVVLSVVLSAVLSVVVSVVHLAAATVSFVAAEGRLVSGIASAVLAVGATALSRVVEDHMVPLRRRSDVRIFVSALRAL